MITSKKHRKLYCCTAQSKGYFLDVKVNVVINCEDLCLNLHLNFNIAIWIEVGYIALIWFNDSKIITTAGKRNVGFQISRQKALMMKTWPPTLLFCFIFILEIRHIQSTENRKINKDHRAGKGRHILWLLISWPLKTTSYI